jgi:hypothetical protein
MVTRVRQKIKGKKEEELVVLDKDETTLGSAAKAGTGPRFMALLHARIKVRTDTFHCSTLFRERYNFKFRNKSNFVKFYPQKKNLC